MKCPIDADYTKEGEECGAKASGPYVYKPYKCTRKKGHKGKHHAHGIPNQCFEMWETKKVKV